MVQTTHELQLKTDGHIKALLKQVADLRYLNKRRAARKAATPKQHKPEFGLDYASPVLNTKAIKASGATFVCRYLASSNGYHNPKDLTALESLSLRRAGIGRVVVWETTAARATSGHLEGIQDAQNALHEATQVGMPLGRPVFFAVDEDVPGSAVKAYFEGVRSILGKETGVYGGIDVVSYLFDEHLVDWGWQTLAWSGGRWEPRAQLQQYSVNHNVKGIGGVDYDRSTAADFGSW